MADLERGGAHAGERHDVLPRSLQDRERQDRGTGGEVEGAIGHRVPRLPEACERATRAPTGG